jgi:hypothetical protein
MHMVLFLLGPGWPGSSLTGLTLPLERDAASMTYLRAH